MHFTMLSTTVDICIFFVEMATFDDHVTRDALYASD